MTTRPLLALLSRLAFLSIVVGMAIVYRVDIAQAFINLVDLHPVIVVVLPLYALWNWIAAIGWLRLQQALTRAPYPSGWELSIVRLQAQTVNFVLPLASMGGEILRASILAHRTKQKAGTTSAVILDKIAEGTAGVAFAVCGVLLALGSSGENTSTLMLLVSLLLLALGGLPLAIVLLSRQIEQRQSRLAHALAPVLDAPRRVASAYYRAVAYHSVERLLTAVEVCLAMWAAGLVAHPADAIFVAAVMTAYSLIFFFIPGQLGAIEAGIVSAFASLGLPPAAALTVALVRRGRQLILIALGTVLMFVGAHRTPGISDPLAKEKP